MKVIDRYLAKETVRFALIALLSVVVIYLLVDLFEELNYFTSRKVALPVVLLYYAYSLPAAVTLLYPVSLLLAVAVVYGQMVRHRELHALESAGVRAQRLFAPAIVVGLATVALYLAGNEWVAVPANARLSDLRRFTIDKRTAPKTEKRRDLYFVGEGGRVFFVQEFESDGLMRNFSVEELGLDRRVRRRIDGREARYRDRAWVGYGVTVRVFAADGTEQLTSHDTLLLSGIEDRPDAFLGALRPVQETSTRDLRRYIAKLRRAGEETAKEEVEYHYRLSYSIIGLVVVLIGLPTAIMLKRGGVMFGLGLSLLVSFLYWGAVQMSRAYGTSHVISPALSAWLPNIVFGAAALFLLVRVDKLQVGYDRSLRHCRRQYLTYFLLSVLAALLGVLPVPLLRFMMGAAFVVLSVAFLWHFYRALGLAGYRGRSRVIATGVVAVLPFVVNVPLFVFDLKMYRLIRQPKRDEA